MGVRKFGQWKKKSLQEDILQAFKRTRRRPTLPLSFPSSTIGSEELNFRVREGIGCGLLDNTTGNFGYIHRGQTRDVSRCISITRSSLEIQFVNLASLCSLVRATQIRYPNSASDIRRLP